MKRKTEYWFGDENSLATYMSLAEKALNVELRDTMRRDRDQVPDYRMLSLLGNVGVISIQGGIHSKPDWLTELMGIPTYPDIREALIEAVEDDRVEHILLDIDSPGGSASGVDDISDLMAKIDKPITAYTSGQMASAAYWIGAGADQIYASRMASVGSIGVIATHMELTKAMEDAGVTVTIFRSGEYKALGGPYEKLNAKAIGVIQERLDTLYDNFLEHVATSRHISMAKMRSTVAEGREFFGTDALKVGLVDGIATIDELVAQLQSQSTKKSHTRMEASDMKKKLLNQQAAAVLEAGGELDAALEVAEEETTEVPVQEPAEAPEASEVLESTVETAVDDNLTSYLKEQLASANEKVTQLTIDNRSLQTKLDAMDSTHGQLREIVMQATNVKRIALGGSNMDLASLSDEALLQQYQQVSAEFAKVYPVGGKVKAPDTNQDTAFIPAHQARLNAVKASKH